MIFWLQEKRFFALEISSLGKPTESGLKLDDQSDDGIPREERNGFQKQKNVDWRVESSQTK